MIFIDLTAFRCPVPLVQVKLALKKLPAGETLEVALLDSASRRDVPAFLEKQGYRVEKTRDDQSCLTLRISRMAPN
ncbi:MULTISPECIES: sulfurtransferase TusA family protein [Shewanella]|jgi:tRNA 2-thiouridine synthesizing protein A|uniref:Sulfurtransferase TusA family protein n=1 Tax=Shewanella zhuhaiensis TaxID=2919576 RepID=A0AAJ1BGE7_9GAMM|nr:MULTISPECIES: sulfurtransferase TusA family protein [Shewanella]MCH4294296.1 sulfurtransferase TusA family protein [Shewanella zhuhaiensis]